MPKLYKHNSEGDYCRFQDGSGELINYPHIIELVFNEEPTETKIQTNIKLDIESNKYDHNEKEYYNNQYGFFDKMIVYNKKQCSGQLSLNVINNSESNDDFFEQQIQGVSNGVNITKKEGNWIINGFRNYVTINNKPLFSREWSKIQNNFPIDKVVNTEVLDSEKDWNELEMFRDKYIIVRLIDTNDDNTKQLTTRIANTRTKPSLR
jgi:hypothetical protein